MEFLWGFFWCQLCPLPSLLSVSSGFGGFLLIDIVLGCSKGYSGLGGFNSRLLVLIVLESGKSEIRVLGVVSV